MSQLGQFERPAPYQRTSRTSKAAATSIEPVAGTVRAVVLAYIRGRGEYGATCEEIECGAQLKHQTASARVRELAQAGLIADSNTMRTTSSGRFAVVWRAA